ncbi:TonB-dependent receptor domain-containing protein [Sphingobium scionense]
MSSYLMANFDLRDAIGFGVRGDVGVRYVKTDMLSSGYVAVAQASSPTGLTGQFAAATNSYDDWLPSANIVVEPVENVLVRFSGAKVMARPELGLLTPTSGVNPVTRVGNVNNPFLDPIRANTFDVAVEWYFRPGSLLYRLLLQGHQELHPECEQPDSVQPARSAQCAAGKQQYLAG